MCADDQVAIKALDKALSESLDRHCTEEQSSWVHETVGDHLQQHHSAMLASDTCKLAALGK